MRPARSPASTTAAATSCANCWTGWPTLPISPAPSRRSRTRWDGRAAGSPPCSVASPTCATPNSAVAARTVSRTSTSRRPAAGRCGWMPLRRERCVPHGNANLGQTLMQTLAIEASGLVKAFGDTRAVDGVDLSVRRGSVYGVLGPNGAGKTTTIRMLATLLRPDAGSARVLGHDIVTDADAVRGLVSLTGQLASVDDELSGRENLVLIGRLLGFP